MRSNNELTLAYNILNTISNKSQYNEVIIRDQYDIYHFTLAVNEFVHNMEWSGSEDGDGGEDMERGGPPAAVSERSTFGNSFEGFSYKCCVFSAGKCAAL